MEHEDFREEQQNAHETIHFLKGEFEKEMGVLTSRRDEMKAINKILWTGYSDMRLTDPERVTEVAQYLAQLNQTARAADAVSKAAAKYERLLKSPYFGRFDLIENDMNYLEKIYIGFHNAYDFDSNRVYVVDWRSPIASVYYRFELGDCYYDAPDGRIEGRVLLKRQLKFHNGELKYFADTGLVINDEILLEALSRNSTAKMKTIVETIQKEQDKIIRDLHSGAMFVNGVAGSGKTSIALHRIAYLMYESKITGVTHKNILALSPSDVFADYIDDVLPSLGEERIKQLTIDDIYGANIKGIKIQTKNGYLESLTSIGPAAQKKLLRVMSFKSSRAMAAILERYAWLYERRLHVFSDIFLDGKPLYSRERLKALFLDNKAGLSVKARLKRIYDKVKSDAEPIFEAMRPKLKQIILEKTYDQWTFQVEARVNVLIAGMRERFYKNLRRQTSMNPLRLYRNLMSDEKLFARLSEGLPLPADARGLLLHGRGKIKEGFLPYADAGAVLYLTSLLHRVDGYKNFRHVVVDEGQDYGVVNYLTFKRLFPNARYTILGDVNQAVGRDVPADFFRRVKDYMAIPKTASLSLNKSYRSSLEIQDFCNKILGAAGAEAFRRTGHAPQVITGTKDELLDHVGNAVKEHGAGVTTAILTKTAEEAAFLSQFLSCHTNTQKSLITSDNEKLSKHLNIMPVYMAKGLEFDFVIVWGADNKSYTTDYERNLLYIACTRALHRLHVCAEGEVSRFLG